MITSGLRGGGHFEPRILNFETSGLMKDVREF